MKKLAAFLCLAALALPMSARTPSQLKSRASGTRSQSVQAMLAPRVVATGEQARKSVTAHLRASSALRNSVRSNAILLNSSARVVAIPAAGSVRGLNNTFFRSDVTLVNYNADDQDLQVYWMPNGGGDPTLFELTLPGDELPFTVPDFVGTVLELQNQLGSLLMIPVNNAGGFDTNAAFDAYSRIWTPQPNASGTVSQPFPGIAPEHMIGHYEGIILGVRQDADFRTNVGIVNYSDEDLDFVITIFPDGGTQYIDVPVSVPALAYKQLPLPAGTYGPMTLAVGIDGDPGQDFNEDVAWTAYASSTDNRTGDGWVSMVAIGTDDEGLDEIGLKKNEE